MHGMDGMHPHPHPVAVAAAAVSNHDALDAAGAAVLAEFQNSMVQYAKSMDDSEAADALANMASVHVDRRSAIVTSAGGAAAASTQQLPPSRDLNTEEVLLREALEMYETPISQQSPFVSSASSFKISPSKVHYNNNNNLIYLFNEEQFQ